MRCHFSNIDALFGVLDQHTFQQTLTLRFHPFTAIFIKLQLTFQNFFCHFCAILVCKGQGTAVKRVDYYGKRPYIYLKTIIFIFNHLWSHVAIGTKVLFFEKPRTEDLSKAKVNKLGLRQVCVIRHHNVLQLYVSVHYPISLQVVDCEHEEVRNLFYSLF